MVPCSDARPGQARRGWGSLGGPLSGCVGNLNKSSGSGTNVWLLIQVLRLGSQIPSFCMARQRHLPVVLWETLWRDSEEDRERLGTPE